MVDYTGHLMTCLVHSILSKTLVLTVQKKIEISDILRCKLLTQSKHVEIYDNLRISLNEALFSI